MFESDYKNVEIKSLLSRWKFINGFNCPKLIKNIFKSDFENAKINFSNFDSQPCCCWMRDELYEERRYLNLMDHFVEIAKKEENVRQKRLYHLKKAAENSNAHVWRLTNQAIEQPFCAFELFMLLVPKKYI